MALRRYRLRPKPLSEFMDELFVLYRQNFRTFLGIGAITYVPAELLQILLELSMGNSTAVGQQLGPTVVTAVMSLFIVALSFPAAGATVIAMMDIVLSHRPTVMGSYRRARPRLAGLAGLYVVVLVAGLALTATGIGIPVALYLLVAWTSAPAALLLEESGVREALNRSRHLVRGNWWRVAGIVAAGALLCTIVSVITGIPAAVVTGIELMTGATGLTSDILHTIAHYLEAASNAASAPLGFALGTLLYVDLRVRKEGLTAATLAQSMSQPLRDPEN